MSPISPSTILAIVDRNSGTSVIIVARAMARLLKDNVETLEVDDSDHWPARALRELNRPDVEMAALAVNDTSRSPEWRIVESAAKPLIAIPANLQLTDDFIFSRVLVPLDGTVESASAITQTMSVLDDAGVELVVLHVFDKSTSPRFWDQAAHARRSWEEEFRARFRLAERIEVKLCTGEPSEHVVGACADEHADLITLGWSQHPDPDRARTVRAAIRAAPVPVMLVPRSDQSVP